MSQESFKPESSQEEIRAKLEKTLASLQTKIQDKVKSYKESLKDGSFDVEDGEKKKEIVQKEINDLLDKAEKLKTKLDSGETLELENNISFPEGVGQKMDITPDLEITSAETAIEKLEKEGYKVEDYAKDVLKKVDWKENLKNSYEIISISVGDLFGDKKVHSYAEIKEQAKKQGLELIPARLAPEIRLNYPESGGWTNIATEGTRIFSDFKLFGVGKALLSQEDVTGDKSGWNNGHRFFFARK